jgi:hypothetical protein
MPIFKPKWDRFDICSAAHAFATECHDGQGGKVYEIFGRLIALLYSAGPSGDSWDRLDDGPRETYCNLWLKYYPKTPFPPDSAAWIRKHYNIPEIAHLVAIPADKLIIDGQCLDKAMSKYGTEIPTYDDGYGPLWIWRNSLGMGGIVRAADWVDAYSICEDEFFPEASETVEELEKEFSTQYLSGRELWFHRGHTWEEWTEATEEMKQKIHAEPGMSVPFTGHFSEHPCFQEQYGFRNNGPNTKDVLKHGIYVKDLNGEALDLLTPELLKQLEIKLETSEE